VKLATFKRGSDGLQEGWDVATASRQATRKLPVSQGGWVPHKRWRAPPRKAPCAATRLWPNILGSCMSCNPVA